MQRVCVLLRSLAPGGAEKQALLLTHVLRERHDVRLVLLDREPCAERHVETLRRLGIEPVFLPRAGAGWLGKAWQLYRLFRRERIQVLFCFLPSDTVLGSIAARLAGVPHIYGGLRNSRVTRNKERALKFVHNHVAHGTVSNSHAARSYFAGRGFRESRWHVIQNGIEIGPEAPAREPSRAPRILTVSRFVPEKDHYTALCAIRAVLDVDAELPFTYTLAGNGVLEPLIRDWIRELGLEERVELVVDPENVEALFANSDLYLSMSHFEGVSNSIMEAMHAGASVVATDVGDNARLVEDGVNGRIVSIGDVEATTRALHERIASSELRQAEGRASRERLVEGFGLDAFQRQYEALLAAKS